MIDDGVRSFLVRSGLLLVLASCVTPTSVKWTRDSPLLGAREVTAVSGSTNELRRLESALEARGIRLRPRSVLHPETLATSYVIDISGACLTTGIRVDVIDREADDVVMSASKPRGLKCPGSIFDDVAAELSSRWAP